MIHLFRVYFDDVADAVEVFALSHDDAALHVADASGRKPEDAVTRYVKSVSDAVMRKTVAMKTRTARYMEMAR